ncbi:MAG TPA: glycosyltransferase family 2 protein [Acidobacteriaceae bacterium]|nr:glycosyltransferase family 2 protein [Acidobacteriaceae bacterium]
MPQPPNSAPRQKLSPILGLPVDDEPEASSAPPSTVPQPSSVTPLGEDVTLELSVIIPARDEQASLPACLASLLAQHSDIFTLGVDWELLVIDDASTDRTRALAEEAAAQYPGVRVLAAPPIAAAEGAFTGKTNACWAGAQHARGRWLLFTDADTLHEPNDLRHALHEAEKYKVPLLSYSPRQLVSGLAQRVLMPLVFSELATVYPPIEVNDPAKRTAAANGQFLLIERSAYFAVGGHRAVGGSVLEDVDLAWNVKRARKSIRLRYAPDALSTRMYRSFGAMVEGWTKNLALLFPHSLRLAGWRLLDILLFLLPLLLWLLPYLVLWQRAAIVLLWLRTVLRFYTRVARAHFGFVNTALSVFGLPLFIALLVRSWIQHHILHQIAWKGRQYNTGR